MPIDLDSWCSYSTEKQVVVRHRWAGILYYSCCLFVLIYVVAVQIIANQGFTAFQALSGTVKGSFLPPASLSPVDSLHYCNQSAKRRGAVQPCVSWDASLTTQTYSNALLVGTRVTRRLQRRNASCGELQYGCAPWSQATDDVVSAYVGDVESGTVLVQHSVSSQSALSLLPGGRDALDSFGPRKPATLAGADGTSVATVPCDGQRSEHDPRCGKGRGDLFTLGQLLAAAGVDLDAPSLSSVGETKRSAGVTLILSVDYRANLLTRSADYSYLVNASRLEAKATFFGSFASTFGAGPNATREVFSLHGVQLIFEQSGGLTSFDFFTLLLTFVSGLALVSISKSITNTFLLYLAPRRNEYRLFLRSQTPDFAPANQAERRALADLVASKRRKRAICDGQPAAPELVSPLAPLSEEPTAPLRAGSRAE
mmetsp:Transcript_36607/g.122587  ORF Transcript_36607/g.122587 Transcript_36607/m.122587 type:complete len:426 (-) Transcript_36607:186-1463(-)